MRKKLTALIMSACLIASLVPTTIFAQTSSKQKPDLTISSTRELIQFANNVSNGNTYEGKLIKLTKDIKFDGVTVNNFETIGSGSWRGFSGTFDGGGYTISGIDQSGSTYGGLFRIINRDGIVKNVTLENSSIVSVSDGGGIAYENDGTIENCHNKADIDGDSSVGGIVHRNSSYGTIVNCSNSGSITSDSNSVGGVAGSNLGIISNSYNTGNIKNSRSSIRIGGVAGSNMGTIQSCYNTGVITITKGYAISESYGGIAGEVSGVIANSFCSEESAPLNIGVLHSDAVDKNNKALPESEMKKASFVTMLNKNRGSNTSWSKWELTSSSEYPKLATKYEVTFKSSKLGYTKTNRSYAYAGQTVTLTAVPNKNYKTSTVVVKTAAGKKVTVKKVNGKYQFKMPKGKVVVTTTFKKK